MLINTLLTLFNRDLNRLRNEISAYQHEANIWKISKNITNPAGNLCLHLLGNLNAYIGAQLGSSNYVRQRDLEFSLKDIPRAELIRQIDDTIIMIEKCLKGLTEGDLNKEYPILVFDEKTSTVYLLVHLTAHLGYHLGQINYHRRLLD